MKPTRGSLPGMKGIYRSAIIVAVILVAVVSASVAIPLAMTSSADFFKRYHLLERRYVNLENSAHEGIGCRSCHETQALLNGAQLVGDFYSSLTHKRDVPRFFTFRPPTNDACIACHENDWSTQANRTGKIPHPAHKQVATETRRCTDCHKWTGHFEAYLDKHKEMPFSGVCVAYGCHVGTKTTEQCFDCHHVLHESADEWKTAHPAIAKRIGENACLEGCHTVSQCQQCHTTGETPRFDGLRIEVSMKSIETLHVRDDWMENHGQEALKGRDRCLLCHQSEGECAECHLQRPAFHGPSTTAWTGRHSKYTKDTSDPACIECHKQAFCDDCHRQFKEME